MSERAGMGYSDMTTLIGQARHVHAVALKGHEDETRTLYAAYQEFWRSRAGQLILENLIGTVLLRPNSEPHHEGERVLVLRVLKMLRDSEHILGQEET